MARRICIAIPTPIAPVELTIPGMGTLTAVREFTAEGYKLCQDAKGVLQLVMPSLSGLSLPLCILGCVDAITKVFDASSFPPVKVDAIPNIVSKCACLTSFTPIGYCGMVKGVVNSVLLVLRCMLSLLNDVVQLEEQAAAFLLSGNDFMAQCMTDKASASLSGVKDAFGPITDMFESMNFLFSFVGVEIGQIAGLSGDSAAEVLASMQPIVDVLTAASEALSTVCP